jgi:hypothetical protein
MFNIKIHRQSDAVIVKSREKIIAKKTPQSAESMSILCNHCLTGVCSPPEVEVSAKRSN